MNAPSVILPPPHPDAEQTLLTRRLWMATWALAGLAALGAALLAGVQPFATARWLGAGAAMVAFFAIVLARTRAGQARSAARMLVTGLIGAQTVFALATGGWRSPAAVFTFIIVGLATLLLGKRGVVGAGSASAAASVLLFGVEWMGRLPPPAITPSVAASTIAIAGLLVVFLAAHYVGTVHAERVQREAAENAARQAQAEHARRASDERLAAVFDAVSEGIFIHDAGTGALLDVNSGACRMSGHSRDDLLRLGDALLASSSPPCSLDEVRRRMHLARTEGPQQFEWLATRADGSPLWFEGVARHATIAGEERIIMTARDVTDRKRSESALRANEQRLSFALEAVNDGLFDLDLQTGAAYCSPRYFTMLGYTPGEFPPSVETWKALLHPGDRDRALAELSRYFEGRRETHEFEVRMRAKDGSWRWILTRGRLAERSPDGRPLRLIGTHVDITERIQAEAALRASEERLRGIADHAPFGAHLYELQADGRLVFQGANQSADRLLGIDHAPLIGRDIGEAFPGLKDTGIPAIYRRVAETGQPFHSARVDYSGGSISGAFDVHAIAIGPKRMVAFFADITERERAAQALRASEERYRMLFGAGSDMVFLDEIATDGTLGPFTEVNDAACTALGYTSDELRQLSPFEIASAETRGRIADVAARLLRDRKALFEAHLVAKDGHPIPVEVNARVFDLAGRTKVLSIVRDTAERKRLEAQLRQSQKMQVFGQLAGGVAHDFNNLLVAILGNTELLLQDTSLESRTRTPLAEIHAAGQRAASLTRQLLLFSRKEKPNPTRADLGAVLGDHVKLLRRIIGEDIELVLDLCSGPLPVLADVNMLEQIVMNLAVNARDAMPTGGILTLRTRTTSLDEDAAAECGCLPGSYVTFEVADTGTGIAPDLMPRLFEPFFTTKPAGKGTGLGLSTVLGIVQEHRGGIRCTSEAGRGTTFAIHLPRSEGAPEPAPNATNRADAPPPTKSATVLVVEDDRAVHLMVERILESHGFRVLDAENAAEGLRLLASSSSAVDVVLTDVVMPGGRNGVDMAREIARRWPHLPILLMSGHARDLESSPFKLLRKPFSVADLVSAIEGALASKPR